MNDFSSTSGSLSTEAIAELRDQLQSASEKNQLQAIPTLVAAGEAGLTVLMEFLQARSSESPTPVTGKVYQALLQANSTQANAFLQAQFPQGLVPLRSQAGIDYSELQQLLAQQEFQAADRLTLQKLCELAGPAAVQRKWLYFTEVDSLAIADLQLINTLWLVYSEGKFGFSAQREVWLSVGKNWDKFWPKIGWKLENNNWPRYPQEFIWDLSAPKGHLPLSNQLRGVRVMAALLAHPAWS